MTELDEAARLFPQRPEPYYHKARGLMALGRASEAEEVLERATRVDPQFLPARILLDSARGEEEPGNVERPANVTGGAWSNAWLEAHEASKKRDWQKEGEAYGRLIDIQHTGEEPYLGSSIEARLGRGRARLAAGDHEGALADFGAAEALWPDLIEPALLLGKTYCLLKRPERGEETFKRLHERARRPDDVAIATTEIYHEHREWNQGIDWADKIKDPALRLGRTADFLCHLGRLEEALEAAQTARELDPDEPEVYKQLGFIFESQNRFDEAIAQYDKALALGSKDLDALYARSQLRIKRGDLDGALSDYDEALRTINADTDLSYVMHFYLLRSAVRLKKGDRQGADGDFSEWLNIGKDTGLAYNRRGKYLLDLGDIENALADATEAIRLNPTRAQLHGNRGWAHKSMGQFENAIADYTEAIRLDPTDGVFHFFRGRVHMDMGKFENAITDYTETMRLGFKTAGLYSHRGGAYFKRGDFEKAIADFTEAIRLEPLAVSYANRGRVYQEMDKFENVIADYTEAIRLDPMVAEFHNRRGAAYLSMARFENAITDVTEAIRLDQKAFEYRYNRGLAYLRTNDFENAIADLTQAIRLNSNLPLRQLYRILAEELLGRPQTAGARELLEKIISELTAAPTPEARQHAPYLYHVLAEVLLKGGDYAEAAKTEEQVWAALPPERRNPAATISVLASCVALAEKDQSLSEGQRKALIEAYKDRMKELAKRIEEQLDPPYVPSGNLICLDIESKANRKVTERFHGAAGVLADDPAQLPGGEQAFSGVRFRIADGLIQLRGTDLPQYPERVEGIQVDRTFRNLYFLHATGWLVPEGTQVGRYEVRYEDNSSATIPIVCGENVRAWYEDGKRLTGGRIGWVGATPKARMELGSRRLYVSIWENPHSEKKVTSIDYISTNTAAAPFCVAITVEEDTVSAQKSHSDAAPSHGEEVLPVRN